MKKMVKKLISFAFGTGLLLATVVPALAVSNDCTNDTTGPGSNNTCDRLLKKRVRLKFNNNGTVNQTVNTTSDSGNNTSNGNTVGGGITAGAASVDVTKSADLNSVGATIDQSDPSLADHGSNIGTGPSSNNTVNITTNKKVKVTTNNYGTINQTLHAVANSGKNSNNGNTSGGSVVTGDASSILNVSAFLNWVELDITQ